MSYTHPAERVLYHLHFELAALDMAARLGHPGKKTEAVNVFDACVLVIKAHPSAHRYAERWMRGTPNPRSIGKNWKERQ